jgi:hypothetical protein
MHPLLEYLQSLRPVPYYYFIEDDMLSAADMNRPRLNEESVNNLVANYLPTQAATPLVCKSMPPVCKKKEDKMSHCATTVRDAPREIVNDICIDVQPAQSDTQQAKDYLRSCVVTTRWEKHRELEQLFGLSDEDSPRDFEEFFKRLKDGRFVLDTKYRTGTRYWRDYIRWRDPDLKEDHKGYDAAKEAYAKAEQQAMHIITVKHPDEGLEALQKLEAWTPKKK